MPDNPTFEDEQDQRGMLSGHGEGNATEDREAKESEGGQQQEGKQTKSDMLYLVDDVPAWHTCALLGLQHFLCMFGSAVSTPLLVTTILCFADDDPARSYPVSATLFVSGIITFIQATVGSRLPIVQGPTFAYLPAIKAIMNLPEWQCPSPDALASMTNDQRSEIWQPRINEVLGATMVASLFQMLLGMTGVIGLFMRFISPLTIVAIITSLGIGFIDVFQRLVVAHWPIAMFVMCLVILFSQYMRNVHVPLPYCTRTKRGIVRVAIFKMFPILLSMLVAWCLCFILTITNALAPDSRARTDIKVKALHGAAWFRVPYPGQWGLPTVSLGAVLGMMAGVVASVIDSVGDYFACARLAGAAPPPSHAINRGILMEGVGGVLCGLLGAPLASSSYGSNIGLLGVTKVGSRRVIQWASLFMVLLGVMTKFGGFFISIPDPVYGGVFLVIFGMITGMGFSTLQYVDLDSTRNLFVAGFSVLFSLFLPTFAKQHREFLQTGNAVADQLVSVVLTTNFLVAGVVAALLDNTVPGTDEERGITAWKEGFSSFTDKDGTKVTTYDLPFGMNRISGWSWTKKIPICPTFRGFRPRLGRCRKSTADGVELGRVGNVQD